MRALHRSASDPVSQPNVLVIMHARGVLAVVTDQRIQTRAQLGRLRMHAFQPRDDFIDLACLEIDSNLADPLVGLPRSFTVTQAGEAPGMLHRMPEIENFTTADITLGPVPDPFGAVAND